MRRLLQLTLFVLFLPLISSAADRYFKGSAPGLNTWNVAANWFTDAACTIPAGAVPGPGDIAIFGNGATAGGVVNITAPVTVQRIQVEANAPAYTFLASQAITLTGAVIAPATESFGFQLLNPSTFVVSALFTDQASFLQSRGNFLMGGTGLTHQVLGNFIINGPAGITPSFVLSDGTNLELGGDFQIIDPSNFAAADNTVVIFRKRVTNNTQIRIDNATNTVATFYNVIFDNGNVATDNIVTFGGGPNPPSIMEIRNNLTLTSGRLNSGTNGGIRLLGNLTTSGTIVGQSSALLEFGGSNIQTISFNGTDNNKWNGPVILNKSGGTITLGTPFLLNGAGQNFTFTNGILNTSATNYLLFGATATTTGASTSSYVDGPIRKTGTTAFTFPTGDAGFYAPIHMSGNTGFNDAFTGGNETYIAEYFHQDPNPTFNTNLYAPPVVPFQVSTTEYWRVAQVGAVPAAQRPFLWLSYEDVRSGGLKEISSIDVMAWLGSGLWQNFGSTTLVSSGGSNFVSSGSRNGTTNEINPVFTLGTVNPILNPLPVEWIDFTGRRAGSTVELAWITASEKNNLKFVVERSADGKNFSAIGSVAGNGTTNVTSQYTFSDKSPLSEASVYRIKQTDDNGKFSYSKEVRIAGLGAAVAGIRLYPNPAPSSAALYLENSSWRNQKVKISIINSIGAIVREEQINFSGDNRAKVNISGIGRGSYYMSTVVNGEKKVVPFIIQ